MDSRSRLLAAAALLGAGRSSAHADSDTRASPKSGRACSAANLNDTTTHSALRSVARGGRMATGKWKIKKGMGGSRCGRSRCERTEVLKQESKRKRREESKQECLEDDCSKEQQPSD